MSKPETTGYYHDVATVRYRDATDLAGQIAVKIFPSINDAGRQVELRLLLVALADEIKRSAIEP